MNERKKEAREDDRAPGYYTHEEEHKLGRCLFGGRRQHMAWQCDRTPCWCSMIVAAGPLRSLPPGPARRPSHQRRRRFRNCNCTHLTETEKRKHNEARRTQWSNHQGDQELSTRRRLLRQRRGSIRGSAVAVAAPATILVLTLMRATRHHLLLLKLAGFTPGPLRWSGEGHCHHHHHYHLRRRCTPLPPTLPPAPLCSPPPHHPPR